MSTTPAWVWRDILVCAGALFVFLLWLTGDLQFTGILFFGILAFTTNKYIVNPNPFSAVLLLNRFTKEMRAVFVGYGPMSPFESPVRTIDLHKPVEDMPVERFSTKGADRMVKMVMTLVPDVSGPNPGEKLVRWASYAPQDEGDTETPKAILKKAKATVRGILSPYFENSPAEDALDIAKAYDALSTPSAAEAIQKFEEAHGAKFGIIIEDIDRTKEERDMLDQLAGIKNINLAIDKLMEEGLDGKGMSREEATEFIKLRTLPNTSQVIWKIQAPPTLKKFSVVGGPTSTGGGKK